MKRHYRNQRLHAVDPFHFAVYAFWALLATICWFSAVSCTKPESSTTIIRETPTVVAPPTAPGMNVKVQGGKDGGVEVDVHGKTNP
jgi:hypothetical protein